jgi:geranylgeranyl diphosphate synthase, type I
MADQTAAAFKAQLAAYKQEIDAAVGAYQQEAAQHMRTQFGEYPALVYDAFLDILSRGGKRIRGALMMAGYEMAGGRDRAMITQAALAVEMLHAYILIIDDIQDRSAKRRGKPSAHELLTDYHREHGLQGDAAHAALSLALNAAWAGSHAAQNVFIELNVPAERRLRALTLLNEHIMVTAHGQTIDIMNELTQQVSDQQINQVLEWKTAVYTVLNPLQVGMILAGASEQDVAAISSYALPAGKAFQIADDVLGIFGNEEASGKSVMDDIREGKRTILTAYALQHASADDQAFLRRALGNMDLTPQDFAQCKAILQACGARKHAEDQAEAYIAEAIGALDKTESRWSPDGVAFLRNLAHALTKRTT